MKTNWPAIRDVAKRLLSKKKLSRLEVNAIVIRCDEEYYTGIDRQLGLIETRPEPGRLRRNRNEIASHERVNFDRPGNGPAR